MSKAPKHKTNGLYNNDGTHLESEFLSNMSHDLRVPLSSIIGITESLIEGVYGTLNSKQCEALRDIEESVRNLLSLISDIIDVSKIEVGKMEIKPNAISIQELCRSSLRFVRSEAQKKDIKISFPKDDAINEVFYADERRLKQILVNLLNNAVKSTPKGGTIGLDVNCNPNENIIQFIVWDTGAVISQDEMSDLFKPSDHLNNKLTQRCADIRLDLVLIQRLVEMHKGNIFIESDEVNKGNRFVVSLPWQGTFNTVNSEYGSGQPEYKCLQVSDSLSLENVLILLAEDNELFAKTIVTYLSIKGAQVIIARNGNDAISMAIENRPDIILMDIQMPDMNGYDAIQYIRNQPDLTSVPVIVLTGLAVPNDREYYLKAGADEYISKTDSLKQLVEVIIKWLSNKPKEALVT